MYSILTNTVVDDVSLQPFAPNQTISKVDVLSPVTGLDSVVHKIISINNSNGVGINSVQTVRLELLLVSLKPINGFDEQPFAVGDEIYVEGIQRVGEAVSVLHRVVYLLIQLLKELDITLIIITISSLMYWYVAGTQCVLI